MGQHPLNWRQTIFSQLSRIVAKCVRPFGLRFTYAYHLWWARQCVLRPNWCAPFECDSDWYDALFLFSEKYNQPYAESHYMPLWSEIAHRLQKRGFKRVLDIGCGPGQMAALLFDRGIESYIGLDFSIKAIEIAKRRVPQATFLVGDARTANVYDTAQYDVIICTEVLEHIEDDFAVVSRFPPGKPCICTVPDFPCESHVRYFSTCQEVINRYARFFERLDVEAFRLQDATFYLIDGVRNNWRIDPDPDLPVVTRKQ